MSFGKAGCVGCPSVIAGLIVLGYATASLESIFGDGDAGGTGPELSIGIEYYAPTAVNIRTGPGTDREVLETLQPGEVRFVSGLPDANGWAAVYRGATADTVGYVKLDLLRGGFRPSCSSTTAPPSTGSTVIVTS